MSFNKGLKFTGTADNVAVKLTDEARESLVRELSQNSEAGFSLGIDTNATYPALNFLWIDSENGRSLYTLNDEGAQP